MADPLIIIPAFNEKPAIGGVIAELMQKGYSRILVVDDGSTDSTAQVAQNHKCLILRHRLNRGKGASMKTGLEYAKKIKERIVVSFDADGQHDPNDIPLLLKKISEGNEVVMGVRDFTSPQIPIIKKLLNYMGNLFTWIVYGLWVSDSQSGLRAYTNEALQKIETSAERYDYDGQVIRELARHSIRYAEVPINVRYTDYSQKKLYKQSFLNGLKTVIRMIITNR